MLSGSNGVFFSCIAAWFTNIFSAWKFLFVPGLFPLFLSSYYRCIDIYHPFPLQFSFYFFVKTTLILYLTSNFFFLRENHSLFFFLFLDKAHFYNVAALLIFVPCIFLFLREKFSPFLAAFFLYMAPLRSLLFFSVCVKFSRNRLRSSVLSFIF